MAGGDTGGPEGVRAWGVAGRDDGGLRTGLGAGGRRGAPVWTGGQTGAEGGLWVGLGGPEGRRGAPGGPRALGALPGSWDSLQGQREGSGRAGADGGLRGA